MHLPGLVTVLLNFLILVCAGIALEIESIVGGDSVQQCRFKHGVALLVETEYTCGGVILDEYHVATAAHCVLQDYRQHIGIPLNIIANVTDLNNKKYAFKTRAFKIFVHAQYEPESLLADIAVITVTRPFVFDKYSCMQKVNLPLDANQLYEGKEVIISGFGDVSGSTQNLVDNTHVESKEMNFIRSTIVSKSACQKKWNVYTNIFKEVPAVTIQDASICSLANGAVGNNPKGTCEGDSGSGLVTDDNTLIGLVSYGPLSCNEFYAPGVHTRVTSHLTFIKKALANDKKCVLVSINPIPVCIMLGIF